jgi:glycosyltransferase involved in cell wall biosynthesis
MKIVNLTYKYFPGNDPEGWIGGFRFFYGIWEEVSSNNEVTYIHFTDHRGNIVRNGLRHLFMKCSPSGLLLPYLLHRRIRGMEPDAVVVHGLMFPLQLLLLRRQLGKKVKIIVQHHAEGPPQNSLKMLLQRMADRCVDAYFFTGKGHADRWVSAGLIGDAGKVKEIMEVSSVFRPMDKTAARRATGIRERHVYLWVGHLNANKNPLLATRAFLRFLYDHQADAALYMIFQSNALLDELKAVLAEQAPASAHIHLVGKVSHQDLGPWFSAADFIISSSYYEGSGVAVCEGISCGCIPILTDIAPFRFMTGGTCGLLYEAVNEDALAEALEKSGRLDIAAESRKTLDQYHRELSFKAIAGRIQEVLAGL